jgi:hypothetical protein
MVSFSGRQWSGLLAAYGQFLLAIDTRELAINSIAPSPGTPAE